MKRFKSVQRLPTKVIKDALDSHVQGMTSHGTDLGPYVEELRQVLFERYAKQTAKELARMAREERQAAREKERQCLGPCRRIFPMGDIELNFYKKSDGTYRHQCKQCHKAKSTMNRRKCPF